MYLAAFMVPSQMCKLPMMPWALTHPLIPSQMLALELCTDSNLDGPFPLWPRGHYVHDFQKQFEMWTRQTTAHYSTVRQSI